MARFYTNTSPLGSLVDGFTEGKKLRDDENYRQAMKDIAQSENFRSSEQFGLKEGGGYVRPKRDANGNFGGYEESAENVQRDQGPMQSQVPEFFKKIINEAKPPEPAVVNEVTPSGVPIKTYPDEPARNPQSGPAPLLKPKETTKLDALAAQADKVVVGEKQYAGQKPDGTDVYKQQALKTEVSGFPGVALEGSPAVPAVPEESANFNPSPMMRAKLQDRITSPAQKDTDRMVPVNTIPPNLRKQIGLPDDFVGSIPSSILKEMIQGSYRAKPKESESISPDIVGAVESIEGGVPLSSAARSLMGARGGQAFSPKEMAILQSAESRRISKGNADRNYGMAVQNLGDKREDRNDKAIERFRKAYDSTGVLSALPFLQQLEEISGVPSGRNKNLSKLPGIGTNIASSLPIIGNAAGLMASKTYGGEGAYQALQGLLNAQIKDLSGAAVSSYEQGRNMVQAGRAPGGDERDVARGIELMVRGLKEADQSVRAGFDPSVIRTYQSQGGRLPLIDELIKSPREKPKKDTGSHAPSEYAEEKSKAISLLRSYAEQVKDQAAVEAKRKEVDIFLKNKHGKGL